MVQGTKQRASRFYHLLNTQIALIFTKAEDLMCETLYSKFEREHDFIWRDCFDARVPFQLIPQKDVNSY